MKRLAARNYEDILQVNDAITNEEMALVDVKNVSVRNCGL
jgi:hypothetical protein